MKAEKHEVWIDGFIYGKMGIRYDTGIIVNNLNCLVIYICFKHDRFRIKNHRPLGL